MNDDEKAKFKEMLEDLIGTRGAYILNTKMDILGKVPTTELAATIKSLTTGIHAVIFDGSIDKDLVAVAEKSRIQYLVAMETKVNPATTRVNLLTVDDF
jgi:hypothetical protein